MRVMNKHFLDNEGTNPFEICKNFVWVWKKTNL
jgi:hypothetical protein